MMSQQTEDWTNPSALKCAGESDPIDFITRKASDVVLKAIQAGWQGPPFDPVKLAEALGQINLTLNRPRQLAAGYGGRDGDQKN